MQKGEVVDPLEADRVVAKGGRGEGSETRKVREMETEMKDLKSELTEIKAKGGIEKEQARIEKEQGEERDCETSRIAPQGRAMMRRGGRIR